MSVLHLGEDEFEIKELDTAVIRELLINYLVEESVSVLVDVHEDMSQSAGFSWLVAEEV